MDVVEVEELELEVVVDLLVVAEEEVVLLAEELVVLDGVYVLLLNVRTYVVMPVAEWRPGWLNSPTANAISMVEPTPNVGKS